MCKLKKLMIDSEFKDLIPPLQKEERDQLEANIRAEGCRDPLTVWGDILIDGHNRHEICTRLGFPFKTVSVSFPDRSHAVEEEAGQKLGVVRNLTTPMSLQFLKPNPFQCQVLAAIPIGVRRNLQTPMTEKRK